MPCSGCPVLLHVSRVIKLIECPGRVGRCPRIPPPTRSCVFHQARFVFQIKASSWHLLHLFALRLIELCSSAALHPRVYRGTEKRRLWGSVEEEVAGLISAVSTWQTLLTEQRQPWAVRTAGHPLVLLLSRPITLRLCESGVDACHPRNLSYQSDCFIRLMFTI